MGRPEKLTIPATLVAAVGARGDEAWLATLPGTIQRVARRWGLRVGEPYEPGGQTAWVAPASRGGRADLVLKVVRRHPESEQEADGLRLWDGDGAVRLHDSERIDPQTTALLLERCRPGTTLGARPEPEQDLVVAGLLHRLWREPPSGHPFRSLQSMCDAWASESEAQMARGTSLDPGMVREGLALFRRLPASADRALVLCTDLHAGNVLAAEREPWLMIDPKPYVGDPTYDLLQHLLNCPARLRTDPHGLVRRMADLTEVDAERLLLWLFARCVQESPHWPALSDVARAVAPS